MNAAWREMNTSGRLIATHDFQLVPTRTFPLSPKVTRARYGACMQTLLSCCRPHWRINSHELLRCSSAAECTSATERRRFEQCVRIIARYVLFSCQYSCILLCGRFLFNSKVALFCLYSCYNVSWHLCIIAPITAINEIANDGTVVWVDESTH